MIAIKNLSKVYKMGDTEVAALNNISLNVDKGEFVAIVGPSGSGKSTLMNIIGCLDIPTSGSYILDGQEVSKCNDNQLSDIRGKKIGFIFQNFNLLTKLTAIENVELPMIYLGVESKKRIEKSLNALKIVGLENRVHHRPTELSGGQQQRVAIARALVTDPPFILADEPTGNLDSKSGAEIMQILKELHKKNNTIVMITHDMKIASEAERVVRILDGKIIAE